MYVAFDVLYRFLRQLGYDVTYVRNFTGGHSNRAFYSALYSCFLCEWPLAAPVALGPDRVPRPEIHPSVSLPLYPVRLATIRRRHDCLPVHWAAVHLLFILLLYFIYLFYTSPLLHAADIDDKIIARAGAVGEDPLALSRRFIDEFHVDMVRGALERDRDGNILSK